MRPPLLITVYSLPGGGKTTDMLYSFPNAWILAPADGAPLDPAVSVVGYDPYEEGRVETVATLEDTTRWLKSAVKHGLPEGCDSVICDDLTVQARATLDAMRPLYPEVGDGVYRLWGDFNRKVVELRNTAAEVAKACSERLGVGVNVAFTLHERPPDDKSALRGGPQFPSKTLSEEWVKIMSIAYRVGRDEKRGGRDDWKGTYLCTHRHPSWAMKSRLGVEVSQNPQNVGELIRASGRSLPRKVGLEWTEEWVEHVAQSVAAKVPREKILGELDRQLNGDASPLLLRWIRRDGFDRAEIRANYDRMVRGR